MTNQVAEVQLTLVQQICAVHEKAAEDCHCEENSIQVHRQIFTEN